MIKKTAVFMVLFLMSLFAHAQGGHVPTTASNNAWAGINSYQAGKLSYGVTPQSCPSGQFVNGLSTTLGPTCGPVGNGFVVYPAQCQQSNAPSWCGTSGQTSDVYMREACSQLPSTGGVMDLSGLTGTIAASVTCSTPTKQVIIIQDPTSLLTITEADGGIVFPISNASMVVGPGGGQCNIGGGFHLASTANVEAVIANAQMDGTEEAFSVQGVCIWGSTSGVAGTTTKGILYAKQVFVNTTFLSNFISVCPVSCLHIENVGGIITIGNNEFNGTSGILTFNTSPLWVQADGGQGCLSGQINIFSTNAEHANGGALFPEMNITGDDSGALNCAVYLSGMYTERNASGTPSTISIRIRDCWSCSFTNIQGSGSSGGDLVNISQSAVGRLEGVSLNNISNVFGSYTNTVNDTTPNAIGSPVTFTAFPIVTTFFSNPGYVQPPQMPSTTVQSLGNDLMNGDGYFSTGSGTLGTNFGTSGCLTGQGTTCTYIRTSSTAPPSATFSQEMQITANTDTGTGHNGVEYTPTTSFIAGQTYLATFWAKGDGTFTGLPEFLLWDPTVPVTYCDIKSGTPFVTAWTPYVFSCTPISSGSSHLTVAAVTPPGSTGTVWFGGFTFAQIQPLIQNTFVGVVSPYGVGSSVNGVSVGEGTGAPTSSCGAPPTASGSLWLRTDGGITTTLYVCNGTTWTAK